MKKKTTAQKYSIPSKNYQGNFSCSFQRARSYCLEYIYLHTTVDRSTYSKGRKIHQNGVGVSFVCDKGSNSLDPVHMHARRQ